MGKKPLSFHVQSTTKYTLVGHDESTRIESAHKTRKVNMTRWQFFPRIIFYIGGCYIFFCLIYFIPNNNKIKSWPIYFPFHNNITNIANRNNKTYLIKTNGCSIPYMDPFDESVKKYFKPIKGAEKDKWDCPNMNRPLLKRNRTHIWIVKENKSTYNITQNAELTCCYQPFIRFDYSNEEVMKMRIELAKPFSMKPYNFLRHRVKYGSCVNFTNSIEVVNEYVKVSCFSKETVVHVNLFIFGIVKNKTETNIKENHNKLKYNVIILGLDGVSRLNFHRTMPKTLSYLKEIGAVELLGYTKVGWNTYPNAVAMLMGLQGKEQREACDLQWRTTFDFCPFVWTWYKQAGFYTAYAEDVPMQTFKEGFVTTPTDYYSQTFSLEVEEILTNGTCIQDRPYYLILLEYAEQILRSVEPVFGFFWESSVTHFYLNAPTLMDDNYYFLLERLNKDNILNKTIFFIVSDHGARHGEIRTTEQGRIEENLPLAYVLTPLSFRKTFNAAFDNLKLNAKRLTSPYDIHETLLDLMDLESVKNEYILGVRRQQTYENKQGVSLFLPIPENRTCETAGIEDQWCTCIKGNKKEITDPEVTAEVANQLVEKINTILSADSRCTNFTLKEVIHMSEEDSIDSWNVKLKKCLVVVKVEPGNAIFEGSLHFDGQSWNVTDKILRISPYGYKSWCIDDIELKPFCICKQAV